MEAAVAKGAVNSVFKSATSKLSKNLGIASNAASNSKMMAKKGKLKGRPSIVEREEKK